MGGLYVDVIILTVSFLTMLYYYGKRNYDHFKRRGIKYIEPPLPYLGNPIMAAIGKEHFCDFTTNAYKIFPEQKYIGLFEMQNPFILVRDLELIKAIGIKDFDHFIDHSEVISEDFDPIFGKSLVSLRGDKWKHMRTSLTPAFTNAKMKKMFDYVGECAKEVSEFYIKKAEDTDEKLIEVEIKDGFTRYTADVIATSAYGFKINSLKTPDNTYYKLSKRAANFTGLQILKIIAFKIVPTLMKFFNITFIGSEASVFFKNLVLNAIKEREESGIVRNDMIHLLTKAKQNTLTPMTPDPELKMTTNLENHMKKWTDEELVGQALFFSIAGFETTSTAITFFFYEMVRNPQIQREVQQEIDDLISRCGKEVGYDEIQSLKFLDMCVLETLRMWPPVTATERVCTKKYTLPPPCDSSKPYELKVGEAVWFPCYAIHRDPRYFPNPDQFQPERFSEENKSSFDSIAYMPFGIGPRSCIGYRLAKITMKLIVFHMLEKFEFIATKKTEIPVILDKSSFSLLSKDGMYLGLKLR